MPAELVKVEIGFRGGDVMSLRVPAADADALSRRLREREDAVVELEAQDGRYLVVLANVLYVKQFSRDSRVGFTSD